MNYLTYGKKLLSCLKTINKNPLQKTLKLLQQEFLTVPEKYLVNTIRYDKEYIWPYIRNELGVALNKVGTYSKKRIEFSAYLTQRGHNNNLPYQWRDVYKKEYGCLDIDDIKRDTATDFLFITYLDSVEDTVLDEKIYKRLSDPLYEKAKEVGNALKIEIVKGKTKKIANIKNYYYETMMILPPFLTTNGFFRKVNIESSFIDAITSSVESVHIDSSYINSIIDWNLHTRNYWLEIFTKINPKVVFCYAFHRQAPMISAAHKLGIKTVDIQHGIQISWHPVYNNWKEMPDEGYQVVPDYFAVWGENEYENIKKIFKGKKHSPIIFGYPWMERQKDFYENIPKDLNESIRISKITILLTLQRQRNFPGFIKQLIINSPRHILWIVRSHPKGKQFKKRNFLDTENVYISDFINHCPINQLFSKVDFNVTEHSTTVYDAGYFNVPSIIVNKDGAKNYKKEISEGNILTAFAKEEFFQTIRQQKNLKINLAHHTKNVNPEEVLLQLLKS